MAEMAAAERRRASVNLQGLAHMRFALRKLRLFEVCPRAIHVRFGCLLGLLAKIHLAMSTHVHDGPVLCRREPSR